MVLLISFGRSFLQSSRTLLPFIRRVLAKYSLRKNSCWQHHFINFVHANEMNLIVAVLSVACSVCLTPVSPSVDKSKCLLSLLLFLGVTTARFPPLSKSIIKPRWYTKLNRLCTSDCVLQTPLVIRSCGPSCFQKNLRTALV